MCRPSDFPPYIDMVDTVDPKQAPSWDSTPYARNAMTEPTTEAGKRLLAMLPIISGYQPDTQAMLIDAIEAEAVNAALDKVDEAVLSIPAANQNPSWVKAQARAAIEAARPKP